MTSAPARPAGAHDATARVRLAPGARVHRSSDGHVLLVDGRDEAAVVRLPGDDERLLVAVLTAALPVPEALARAEDATALQAALAACEQEGLLDDGSPAPGTGAERLDVVLLGEGPVRPLLTALLLDAGAGVSDAGGSHTAIDPAELGPEAVVVSCAGALPDSAWRELDARLAGHVPWHRCHVEGTRLVLGPLSLPPARRGDGVARGGCGASYADARARRLAASGWPDELEALWAQEDPAVSGRDVAHVPAPGQLAVAAGLLLQDLDALGRGLVPAGAHDQVLVGEVHVERHRVLPLPTGIMRLPAPGAPTGPSAPTQPSGLMAPTGSAGSTGGRP